MERKPKSKSDQYTTSGIGGYNYILTIDDSTPEQKIVHPTYGIPFSGRTTIELHNNGSANCYIYFKGATPTEGRILEPGNFVAYAIIDKCMLYALSATGNIELRVTEIM